jgi:hypothetical protein
MLAASTSEKSASSPGTTWYNPKTELTRVQIIMPASCNCFQPPVTPHFLDQNILCSQTPSTYNTMKKQVAHQYIYYTDINKSLGFWIGTLQTTI